MATRVTITKALEAQLRKGDAEALSEVLRLIDRENEKRAAAQGNSSEKSGLSYKELVALFRFHLGSELLVPPKPSPQYVIKLVNQAKKLGVDSTNVERIVKGARRGDRGPYRLATLVYDADLHWSNGAFEQNQDDERGTQDLHVFTGRDGVTEGEG